MFNFSKIMKSLLREEPIRNNPQISDKRSLSERRFNAGSGGHSFEDKVVSDILPDYKGGAKYKKVPKFDGAASNIKTDVYEERDKNDPTKNVNYSVKSKSNNDSPIKVHQTAEGFHYPLYTKLGLYDTDEAKETIRNKSSHDRMIKEDPLKRALSKIYGSPFNSQMMSFADLNKEDNEAFKAIANHLQNNKYNIFESMVMKNGIYQPGDTPYRFADPKPVDKLLTFINKGFPYGERGHADIRDLSPDRIREGIENLQWRFDGGELQLSEKDKMKDYRSSHNNRLLTIYPIDEDNSKWDLIQGDKNEKREGTPEANWQDTQRGAAKAPPGRRGWGQAEPGHMKAAMGANAQMLDRVLGRREWQKNYF